MTTEFVFLRVRVCPVSVSFWFCFGSLPGFLIEIDLKLFTVVKEKE
jgi:hypothetical protein